MHSATAHETAKEFARKLGRNRAADIQRRLPVRPGKVVRAPNQPRFATAKFTYRLVRWSLVACIVAFIAWAAATFVGNEMAKAGHTTETDLREIVIGDEVLAIPANMLRFPAQRKAVEADRLDLYAHWPQMDGYNEALADVFQSQHVEPSVLFLTVEPRAMSQEMSGRLNSIYAKFFASAETNAGQGLKRRLLSADQGFDNEELVYEAGSPYPWVARCLVADNDTSGAYCIRDIHAGRDLMVTYRFHRDLLGQWRALEAAVRAKAKTFLR